MRQLPAHTLICVLLMAAAMAEEDIMFFADDSYKAIGGPKLLASATNPVLASGSQSTLKIILVNSGHIQELIPIQSGASQTDLSREASYELHNVDAVNITARLAGSGPLEVVSGPINVAELPSGGTAQMEFNISKGEGAEGWYSLLLYLDYERQLDAKVTGGSISSLCKPEKNVQSISVLVKGPKRSIAVEEARSELRPGENGTIILVIKNSKPETAKNCSARLVAIAPFQYSGQKCFLGDLEPGQAAIAKFSVFLEEMARPQKYRLACEISDDKETVMVSLPVLVREGRNHFPGYMAIFAIALLIFCGLAFWRHKGQPGRTLKPPKRWPFR